MIAGHLVVGEEVPRSTGRMSMLRPILLLNEGDTGGQQGIGRQGSAQVQRERSDTVAARWAEVPHLIRLDRASNWKMLLAGRRRACPCHLRYAWGASQPADP